MFLDRDLSQRWLAAGSVAVALLCGHALVLYRYPPVAAEAYGYLFSGAATLCSAVCVALLLWDSAGSTRYRWALVFVALLGRAFDYVNAADSNLHAVPFMPRSLGFWSLALAFALFLLALTAVSVGGSRFLQMLDLLLVALLCLLRYVAEFGGGRGVFPELFSFFGFVLMSDLFLLVAAVIAYLAAVNFEQARFARLIAIYFLVQFVSAFCANQIGELWLRQYTASPWSLACTAGELVFCAAALHGLRAEQPRQLPRWPNLVARSAMPAFLTVANILIAIEVFPEYRPLAIAATVISLLCYAGRTTYLHRYFVLANNDLVSRNHQLEDLVTRDPLTGVGNRRSLAAALDDHCAKAARSGQCVYLLLLDLDGFKEINDRAGHLYGDRCLFSVAAALGQELRHTEHHLARYGGDEFAVVLRVAGLSDALRIAEDLRCAVCGLEPGAPDTGLSVSIGIAGTRATAPVIAALLEAADQALYAAKRNGRNRIELFAELTAASPEGVCAQ